MRPAAGGFPKLHIEIDQFRFSVVDLLFGRLEPEHLDGHCPDAFRELGKRVMAAGIRSGDDF